MAGTTGRTATAPRSPYHGKRMTVEEFERLPEEKPYLEYMHGMVVQKAVPRPPHARVQIRLGAELLRYEERTGGSALTEIHVWFERPSPAYLVPDAAYWAPGKPQGDDRRALPPTLAIEVRSPDETLDEQRAKCRLMRAGGVDVCWLFDPATQTVEVFEGDADGLPHDAATPLTSPHLPGFALDVSTLWASAGA